MKLTSYQKKVIKKHFREMFPDEGCGLLLIDGKYIRCDNVINRHGISEDDHHVAKDTSFMIDIKTYLKYSGKISAIIHSHVTDDDAGASNMDLMHKDATCVDWIIFVFGTDGKYIKHYEI